MRYWWVNQKQTYRHEVPGGYLWSPKRNRSGRRFWSYELMRELSPGDVVFSFANSYIKAVGLVVSNCYEFPKPQEFGRSGEHWGYAGWRVRVSFHELPAPVRPRDYMDVLGALLPEKHSPLKADGTGNQNLYIVDISERLALAIASLLDKTTIELVRGNYASDLASGFLDKKGFDNIGESPGEHIEEWENRVERALRNQSDINETDREALIKARRGQGRFRERLREIERACRITGVKREEYLVASHTKPWRDCETNEERLDPENGFMLTRSIDHLFDRGFISFEGTGGLIISPVAHGESLQKMGVPINERVSVGSFTEGQKRYLEWHREEILLKSNVG